MGKFEKIDENFAWLIFKKILFNLLVTIIYQFFLRLENFREISFKKNIKKIKATSDVCPILYPRIREPGLLVFIDYFSTTKFPDIKWLDEKISKHISKKLFKQKKLPGLATFLKSQETQFNRSFQMPQIPINILNWKQFLSNKVWMNF
jgi:hypothetical protein